MKHRSLIMLVILPVLFAAGCLNQNSKKARASQLSREINEIAQNSDDQLRKDHVMENMQKLNELRDHFPDNRSEIEDVAKDAKAFFAQAIEDDDKIIERYSELMSLGLVQREADCTRLGLESEWLEKDSMKLTIDQLDLLFDENIKDKGTLEARTRPIKDELERLEAKNADNEEAIHSQCSKSALDVE